jgi:2-methylcitrate dehydratase PrpD
MQTAGSMVTTQLAAYASNVKYSDLPPAVQQEALRSVFNFLGCTLGGARHEGIEIADMALAAFTGKGHATLIGRGRRLAGVVNPMPCTPP